jgi:hypothetical protein
MPWRNKPPMMALAILPPPMNANSEFMTGILAATRAWGGAAEPVGRVKRAIKT